MPARKRSEEHGTTRFTLYESKGGHVVLFGEWRESSNEMGYWIFGLTPSAPREPAPRKPAVKRKKPGGKAK